MTIASAPLVGVWLVVLFQPAGVTAPSRSTADHLLSMLVDKELATCRHGARSFRWVLWSTACSDRSSVTVHLVPQAVAGGDHPRAQRSPWPVETCHIPDRAARGLQRSGRSRSLPSALGAQARRWCWRILARQFLHFAENLGAAAGITALAFRKFHRLALLISCSQALLSSGVSGSMHFGRPEP